MSNTSTEEAVSPSTTSPSPYYSPEIMALAAKLHAGKYVLFATDGTDVQIAWQGVSFLERKMILQYYIQHIKQIEEQYKMMKHEKQHQTPAANSAGS